MTLKPRSAVFSRLKGLWRKRIERWESYCNRCGRCCYEKDIINGKIVVRDHAPCEYLDTTTRLCRVYDHRFSACPECRKMTIFHALFVRYLPDECGYVKHFRFWRSRDIENKIQDDSSF